MSAMIAPRQKCGGAEVAAPLPIAAPGALYAVDFPNEIENLRRGPSPALAGVRLHGGV